MGCVYQHLEYKMSICKFVEPFLAHNTQKKRMAGGCRQSRENYAEYWPPTAGYR